MLYFQKTPFCRGKIGEKMVALDLTSETTSSSPLSLGSSKEDKPNIDFSKLLKGIKVGEKGLNIVQNGALVLSLESVEKGEKVLKNTTNSDTLLSLLKNDELRLEKNKEPLDINPKITNLLSVKELKILVSNAKNYLKSKILQSDDYKQLQIKELPKTLKGLAFLARKVGIEVSKITLEEVHPEVTVTKSTFKTQGSRLEIAKTTISDKEQVKIEVPHAKEIIKVGSEKLVNPKIIKHEARTQENFIVDEKKIELLKEIKHTPIFKPQTSTEHTTEQLVQVKQFKVEQKTPKDRANETLKLLLSGEKPSSEVQQLSANFSVETAKVLAPRATTESSKELESLLHDKVESSQDKEISSKVETITPHKVDSFEVKLNEAKQMIKYLSQDVKTAIEDYKSPFTRVKIQLNPQRLGEIDLTVVQRGKNLHINLSSNSTAINTLSMNATELKAQLNNSGVNNASLNFNNSGSQGNDAQNTAGQQHQHKQQAEKEYGYLQQEEASEELLSSLEIIVPRYI